jgi:hypothetical protein
MWKFAWIAAVLMGTAETVNRGGYSFVKVGRILSGLAYGHVIVDFNLTRIDEKAQQMKEIENLFRNLHTIPNTPMELFQATVVARMENTLVRYENMAGTMFTEKQKLPMTTTTKSKASGTMTSGGFKLEHIPNLASNKEKQEEKRNSRRRRKRQVLMLAAALGMMGIECINGVVTQSRLQEMKDRVSEVENRQERILSWITEDKTQIRVNTKNLEILRKALTLENDQIAILIMGAMIEMELTDFNYDLGMIDDVIQSAMSKKMVPRLIEETTAKEKLSEIEQYANKNGLSMLIESVNEMMQLDVGFTIGKRMVSLIIHVPLARREHIFQLKKYVGMPLRMTDNSMATVTDPEGATYLGWSNFNKFYITLTAAELHTCNRIAGNYFCNNLNTLRHKDVPSCLEALYEEKEHSVLSNCNIHVSNTRLVVKQMTTNTFGIFNEKGGTYVLFCPPTNDETKHHYQSNDVITVPQGCHATVGGYRLTTRPFAESWGLSASYFSWRLSFQDIFGEHDTDSVQSLLAGWKNNTKMARHELIWALENRKGTSINKGTWIINVCSMGMSIALFVFLCWSYKKNCTTYKRLKGSRGASGIDLGEDQKDKEESEEAEDKL